MKIKQRGFFVSSTRLVGVILILYGGFVVVNNIWWATSALLAGNRDEASVASVFAFFALGMAGLGYYFMGTFPDLTVTTGGFRAHIAVLGYSVAWDDVTALVRATGPFKLDALLINRNGMILNRIYGRFWTGMGYQPVILLSPGYTNLNQLEEQLKSKSRQPP